VSLTELSPPYSTLMLAGTTRDNQWGFAHYARRVTMACVNPASHGKLCKLGEESFKKVCVRCKWSVAPEEADRIRKQNKYNAKIQARHDH
jgi:hypothetical protein